MGKKLSSTIHMYNWFLKLIAAALLIALAITLYFLEVERLIEGFVGVVIAVYAVIRLVPYIKSQKSDLIKTINIIEITLNILIAAVLIIASLVREESLGALFGYMVGGVLVARGMVHFYSISYGAEEGDHITYFFHVATLIIGTLILSRGFESSDLIILMMIAALLASGYLGFESYNGYNNYRKYKNMQPSKEDDVRDEVSKGIDAPGKHDEDIDRDRPVS